MNGPNHVRPVHNQLTIQTISVRKRGQGKGKGGKSLCGKYVVVGAKGGKEGKCRSAGKRGRCAEV